MIKSVSRKRAQPSLSSMTKTATTTASSVIDSDDRNKRGRLSDDDDDYDDNTDNDNTNNNDINYNANSTSTKLTMMEIDHDAPEPDDNLQTLIVDLHRILYAIDNYTTTTDTTATMTAIGENDIVSSPTIRDYVARANLAQSKLLRIQELLESTNGGDNTLTLQLNDEEKKQLENLRIRVNAAVANAHAMATTQPRQEDDDIVTRIFGQPKLPTNINSNDKDIDKADDTSTDSTKIFTSSIPTTPPQYESSSTDLPIVSPQQSSTANPSPVVVSPPAKSTGGTAATAAASVEDIQTIQREQMEEAIAQMASQMKIKTQTLHATLTKQTDGILQEMEVIAEENVTSVSNLAKETNEHVRKSWSSSVSTWASLIAIVAMFAFALITIFMIPKKSTSQLFNRPNWRKSSSTSSSSSPASAKTDFSQWPTDYEEYLQNMQQKSNHQNIIRNVQQDHDVATVNNEQILNSEQHSDVEQQKIYADSDGYKVGYDDNGMDEQKMHVKADEELLTDYAIENDNIGYDVAIEDENMDSYNDVAVEHDNSEYNEDAIWDDIGDETIQDDNNEEYDDTIQDDPNQDYENAVLHDTGEVDEEAIQDDNRDEYENGIRDDTSEDYEDTTSHSDNDVYEDTTRYDNGEYYKDAIQDGSGEVYEDSEGTKQQETKEADAADIPGTGGTTATQEGVDDDDFGAIPDVPPGSFQPRDIALAAATGKHDLLRAYLLQRSGWVDVQDHNGWAPIHEATTLGQTKSVQILIKAGCTWTLQTYDGLTALDLARTYLDSSHPLIEILSKPNDSESTAQSQSTGSSEMEIGADGLLTVQPTANEEEDTNPTINLPTDDLRMQELEETMTDTPPHGNMENDDKEARNIKTFTAAELRKAAVEQGSGNILQQCLYMIRHQGDHGDNKNPNPIVSMLNEPDENGWTALHLAVDAGIYHNVKALLESGADYTILTQYTKNTPLDIAYHKYGGDDPITQLLEDYEEMTE